MHSTIFISVFSITILAFTLSVIMWLYTENKIWLTSSIISGIVTLLEFFIGNNIFV